MPRADDVEVTGIVTRQWGRVFPGEHCDVELMLLGNSLFVQNQRSSAVDLTPSMQQCFINFWRSSSNKPLAARNQIVSRQASASLLQCDSHSLTLRVELCETT